MTSSTDGQVSPQARSSEEKEYVAGLEKGLSIIEAFGIQNRAMTLSEAAEITGHTRASARRSLLTLQRLGYVEWDGKYFKLAPRVLRLGHAYVTSNPLSKIVQPILEALSERSRESSSLAVLDNTEVVFVARAATRRSLSNGLSLGSRLPAFCAATGRVLLAALPPEEAENLLKRSRRFQLTPHTKTDVDEIMGILEEVRRHGYSLCDEELELGVRSISVPVRDAAGRVVSSMSVVASTARYTHEQVLASLLPQLESARRMLSTML
ncbi:IclR family transcriptional regulator C-terminal domain-containing protein [Undibacterium sp.]|uniref:IclR family transcriptional regulator domain-containing protein n=1 Tax=Undibacterium sp. TaxID=1914977 RepID=UPI00374D2AD7